MAANVQLGSAKTGRRWCFEFSVQRQKLKASLSRFAPPPPARPNPQINFWEDASCEALDEMPWAPV